MKNVYRIMGIKNAKKLKRPKNGTKLNNNMCMALVNGPRDISVIKRDCVHRYQGFSCSTSFSTNTWVAFLQNWGYTLFSG